MNDRLYRSRDERVIGGVAGGLADSFAIDPTLVRVAWVVLAIVSGGAFVLIYLVMLVIVPEEPLDELSADPAPAPAVGADWRALRAQERARRREARAKARREGGSVRNDRGPIVFGLILIALGGWFLLREYVPALDWDRIWPLLVIGLGVAILLSALRRDGGATPGGPTTPTT